MRVTETTTGTVDEDLISATGDSAEEPGLVVVFSGARPRCDIISLAKASVVLGREPGDGVVVLEDDRVSRRHVRLELTRHGLHVTDLGSRNGTFVDGRQVTDRVCASLRTLRVGHSILLFVPHLRQHLAGVEVIGDVVVGSALRAARKRIARAGAAGEPVLLTGPSGAGKELGARLFHQSTGRQGPFVAVNCATIPANLAERLLFGARRGAYSGANADAEGFVVAAHGGTLFLDEVAELDLGVQAKLLRVLDAHEVVELGAVKPRRVDIRLCAATLKDLRTEVQAHRFREDLYFRIGRPEVRLPDFSERLEEAPWLVAAALARVDGRLVASAPFVQECLLRPWPGNVRELLSEVGQAGRAALEEGRTVVVPTDLAASAGQSVGAGAARSGPGQPPSREAVLDALRRTHGNVTGAARELGMHRNQLRRWLTRHDVNPLDVTRSAGNDDRMAGPDSVSDDRVAGPDSVSDDRMASSDSIPDDRMAAPDSIADEDASGPDSASGNRRSSSPAMS